MNGLASCLILGICLIPICSQALSPFCSASASALSGITLLSDSPADFTLSPLIASTGICASYQKPFNLSDTSLYGLHSAFSQGVLSFASGINYLDNPAYRWQDEYLCLGLVLASIKLGATQHLIYEKIASDTWFTWDNDYALGFEGSDYGMELRCNNARSSDAALVLSACSRVGSQTRMASSCTWRRHERSSYAVASVYQIAKPLALQTSWQDEPSRFGFGIRVSIKGIDLQYAVQTHPELSLTHSVDIGTAW